MLCRTHEHRDIGGFQGSVGTAHRDICVPSPADFAPRGILLAAVSVCNFWHAALLEVFDGRAINLNPSCFDCSKIDLTGARYFGSANAPTGRDDGSKLRTSAICRFRAKVGGRMTTWIAPRLA
jgi:hypothetical protein